MENSISFDSPPASSSISFDAPPVFSSVPLDCSSFSSSQGVHADTQIISDSAEIYTTEIVTLCLKHKKQHYTILDKKSRAKCWSVFGVPAKILGKDKYEIIKNFASCKTCYQTYSYSSTATTLTNHKCPILTNKNQSTLENFPVSRSTSTKPMFSSTKLDDAKNNSF